MLLHLSFRGPLVHLNNGKTDVPSRITQLVGEA
jgi:hypothetical protein